MAKVTWEGLIPPDDPIYTGGLVIGGKRLQTSRKNTPSATQKSEPQESASLSKQGLSEMLNEEAAKRMRQGFRDQVSPSGKTEKSPSPTGEGKPDSKV
jgi:hypothetical protein